MEELKLESPGKIKVVFEGKDYVLSKPTLGASRNFSKSFKAAGEDGAAQIDALIEFISACGLPKEVCENLVAEEINKVADMLTSKKKN